MRTFIRLIMVLAILTTAATAFAGSLDSPGAPAAGSGMPTLTDIYNQLDTGATSTPAASFQEPLSGPAAGTGKSLSDLKDKLPAPDNTDGATTATVLSGKTFWGLRTDGTWGLKTGTLSSGSNVTGGNGLITFPIPDGYYLGRTATANDADLVGGNIRSGVSIFGVSGSVIGASGNATAGDVLSGRTFSNVTVAGITGSMPNIGAVTITPGTINQAIPAGYHSGSGEVTGDADLVGGNIRSGVSIFGVSGAMSAYTCTTGNLSPLGRWCDNENGTVMDMTTGLIWLRDAGWGGLHRFWVNALIGTNAHDRAAQAGNGTPASLTDGSVEGDWRLPTKSELVDLITGTEAVRSTNMYKFLNVRAYNYWSSTTYAGNPSNAWGVYMWRSNVSYGYKDDNFYVWPVRAGTP